ncbi:hypothetical protein Fisuc_2696 [Fibrobacter succinogenes subsp. succinogenes S85]|uniref:Type II CBASS E2 protein domain-containing protein n=2 Tax=Fibrobacter succinogenes (strain ATCC 19169 / S85) TaxID=59374 RepID=A0ABM5LLA4_FIBSS|nr:hypothetical protein [Fibrobacter succinogenes]ACX76279.1 hypothetical protein Fisuc_2696 [Fibrobacter succinogenes subsp. succinogenes S85]
MDTRFMGRRRTPIEQLRDLNGKYVVNPKPLELAEGATRLEHVYDNQKQRLCLYHPKKRPWDRSMLLSETVIPWAIEWLYFYEIWLCTGQWLGGGEHPVR